MPHKPTVASLFLVAFAVGLNALGQPPVTPPSRDVGVASAPSPGNEATETSTRPVLAWKPGQRVRSRDGHMVFVGLNHQEVSDAFYRNHPNVDVHVVSTPTLELSELTENTTYYWRVDQTDNDSPETNSKGEIWSFTTGSRQRGNFSDTFSTAHDYLNEGIAASGWDGFLGKSARETADRIATEDGKLFLQSTRGRYQEGWDPLGPLLYKNVTGDFKATVRVVDYQSLSYNNGGIMARVASPDDAGPGEDWISIDYFPIYGGIYARMADDNRRKEKGSNGQGKNADKFLQLELIGNLFFLRHSSDGKSWQELPDSPITRNDLVNVPLQVGLFQATYSDNQGEVSFDDFSLERGEPIRTARPHTPVDGDTDRPQKLTLSWIPGSGAVHHDIYLGDARELVAGAGPEDREIYRGRQPLTDIDLEIEDLVDGKTYYWRIDEVTGDEVHAGPTWSFTVYDRLLAGFENVRSDADLQKSWTVDGGGQLTLSKSDAAQGKQSLRLQVNDSNRDSRVNFTFPENQDWLSSTYGFRSLRVQFKGDPSNRCEQLYMAFEDDDWGSRQTVVMYEGEIANLKKAEWTRWDIDLRRLVENNPTFRTDRVRKMSVGVVGAGTFHFDDLSVEYERPTDDQWPSYVQPNRFVNPVPFDQVTVTGGIWRERMDVNRTVSLPHVWSRCESSRKANGDDSKRLENFAKAGGQIEGEFTGTYFNDSDVYKIIEGTANTLQNHPDVELEAYTDQVIDSIAAAQWDDGYVYTFYSLPDRKPSARWSNVGSMHELYCAGHLIEAAVAYQKATGKRKLLDVAIRFADLICDTFGPGKKSAAPGHQEIELALVKLYRLTGNQRYIDTAKFFIDQRGRGESRNLYGTYSQDHIPFVSQEKGVGHSVRAGYLYCAATDIAMQQGDEAYANALFRLWDNITNTKTYITGGIGQPGGPEGFAGDYELGNSCYAETCSGIAFAMWNHRLHQMTGESKYADLVERTFLNNMLSSLSAEGDKHYYTNPLTTNGRERWPWPGHDCACCPSNLVRVISSISGYAYTQTDDSIHVNQYLTSRGEISINDNSIELIQTTNYPWDGDIAIEVRPDTSASFAIKLRIPGWARNQPMPGNLYQYVEKNEDEFTLSVNGSPIETKVRHGYVEIRRSWQAGDTIRLDLPMPIRRVVAHPRAVADKGLVAIERGPIVYCAEFKDNAFAVSQLKLNDATKLHAEFEEDMFGGVVTISGDGDAKLKLIPYYLYANRGNGWMRVWMPRQEK